MSAALASLPRTAAEERTNPTGPRNLLLITVDTLRADHLGVFGYERPTSPQLDSLRDSSAVFERAYSVSSWTLPSIVSMLTGVYPSAHGCELNNSALPEAYDTLTERLAADGFSTKAVTSHVYLSRRYQLDQGFTHFDEELVLESNERSHEQVSSPRVTEKGIAWLEDRARARADGDDSRWFLWLHYFDPHALYRDHPETVQPFGPQPIDRYDSEIYFTDHHIGRVLERLSELALSDETLVIVTADHGEEFGDHGGSGHRATLYEEVLRVPLLLRGTDIEPRRISTPVSLVDLAPTALELLGVTPLRQVEGVSLAPLLRSPSDPGPDRPLLAELRTKRRRSKGRSGEQDRQGPRLLKAIVHGRWKLIRDAPDRYRLFDIDSDPLEMRDLSESEPERTAQLAEALRDMIAASKQIATDIRSTTSLELSEEEIEKLRDLGYIGDD